jgi:RimJ/RimL family protein N-acetyltransferase
MDRIIKTQRLRLRPLHMDDATDIATQIDDYDIACKLARVPHPYSVADAVDFLEYARDLPQPTRISAICLTETPQNLRGIISYEKLENGNVDLGYWLAKPLWGNGLMTEAALAMVDHAFTIGGVENLTSSFFDANPASGKVLQHAGFEIVGSVTHHSRAQGSDVPAQAMLLTRARWLQNTRLT